MSIILTRLLAEIDWLVVVRRTGEARDVLSCVECPFDRHQLIPIAIDYSQSMPMHNVYLSFGNSGWVESPVFDAAVQF